MKILEKSESSASLWSLKVICTGHGNDENGCASKLELERSDLRYYPGEVFPWRIEPAAVLFKCPICKSCTDLDPDLWPKKTDSLTKFSTSWRDSK